MKFSLLFLSLTFAVTSALAEAPDMGRCMLPFGAAYNEDGNDIVAQEPYRLKNKRTDGNKVSVVIESVGTGYYGPSAPVEITFEKDSSGKITSVTTGGSKPNQQTMEFDRSMWTGQSAYGSTFGLEDRIVRVQRGDEERWVAIGELTNREFRNADTGLTKKEFKALRKQWKHDKKSREKLSKAYGRIYDSTAHLIPFGSVTEFEYLDGVCVPKKVSTRTWHSQQKKEIQNVSFDKANCPQIKEMYQQFQEKINQCNEVNSQMVRDTRFVAVGANQSPGFAAGLGSYGFGGGGGYPGFGGHPITMLETANLTCNFYSREGGGGIVGGSMGGQLGQPIPMGQIQ